MVSVCMYVRASLRGHNLRFYIGFGDTGPHHKVAHNRGVSRRSPGSEMFILQRL